jgi:hypothetical protein
LLTLCIEDSQKKSTMDADITYRCKSTSAGWGGYICKKS